MPIHSQCKENIGTKAAAQSDIVFGKEAISVLGLKEQFDAKGK